LDEDPGPNLNTLKKNGRQMFWENEPEKKEKRFTDSDQNSYPFNAVSVDVTTRKKVEQALIESEDRYRTLVEASSDAILLVDGDRNIISCNPAFLEMFGYSLEELEGKSIRSLHLSDERYLAFGNLVYPVIEKEGKARLEWDYRQKNNEVISCEIVISPIPAPDQKMKAFVCIIREITERKQAEVRIRQEREQLAAILDGNPIPTIVIDKNHKIILWNRACENLTQVQREKVLDRPLDSKIFYPDQDRPLLIDLVLEMDQVSMKKFYGDKGLKANTSMPEAYEGSDLFLVGGVPRHLYFLAARLRDSEGKIIGTIETLQDISERERLEKQFFQAQKMEAVGTLAGGIAHDFNNILMGIQGYASLMIYNMSPENSSYEKLMNIQAMVRSGSELTKRLLGFARRGKYETCPTDLNEIIEKTSTMFGRANKEIQIHKKFQEDLFPVEVDQGQIEQVLLNLYVNAWQAMPAGGDLFIETKNVVLDKTLVKPYSFEPGNYLRITISDTGIGMDSQTKERIFEPFFTTKEMGRGTGLGLASVYGIIKNHQGIIEVDSEKGQGATFTIYLPATGKKVIKETSPTSEIMTGTETILLVDDEETIINVCRDLFESLGYRVLSATTGPEALEIYTRNQSNISLVLLDMIMPGMGGKETFTALKEINPQVQVILSSGYSLDGPAREIMEQGCKAFIQKPFSLQDLSEKVRTILDGDYKGRI
jgi:two-component system, cell cycle sensor histidine kinase and response regulator CckA